ncbi:MAG TPA: HDIG domain-containing protein [candidate division Zixibacteria bacterium]|jgi:tRNA nucleotidyltransferase (CCA-adding enzyme)
MNEQRPLPDWIAAILSAGKIYEVGGTVRDRLLGSTAVGQKDADYLVCKVPMPQLQRLLRRFGIVNLVGRSFGVIKFTPHDAPGMTHDLALPRRERSTGQRHTDYEVDYDSDLPVETDLLRRDFTINAIAEDCETGGIIDPANGRADIAARTLRLVFPRAFDEDPLRILRGAQFAARFGLSIDPATKDAMARAAGQIATVSMERVAEELSKLMTLAPCPSVGLKLLQEIGVVRELLPELEATVGVEQPGGYHAYDVFVHTLHTIDACAPRLRLRWAALLHDINKPQCRVVDGDKATFYGHEKRGSRTAARVLRRLRYPHDVADAVATLVDKHMFTGSVADKGLRRLIRRVGVDLIYDLLDLRRADVIAQGKGGNTLDIDELERNITSEISRKAPFGRADLAINGDDLRHELGLMPGPELGRIIDELVEAVLDDPLANDRAKLFEIARNKISRND